MAFRIFSRNKLMEASEEALTSVVDAGPSTASYVIAAERLLEDSQAFRAWEMQHERMMTLVADRASVGGQLYSLRELALTQIHRKSVFDVLRQGDWTHPERRYFFRQLYNGRGDEFAAILGEHRQFLQAASSHICMLDIGDRFMHDAVFDTWLADYEKAYNRYMQYYITDVLEQGGFRYDPATELRAGLKAELAETRRQILTVPRVPKRSRSGQVLRVATGDTARLPLLVLDRKGRIATG